MDEILHLFYLHKVFNFFLENYAKGLPPLYPKHAPPPSGMENANSRGEISWETSVLPIELSHTEKHRLLRALCRLQIYANIFGQPECHWGEEWLPNDWASKEETDSSKPATEEAWRVFFGTIPPWEYHEMACVWAHFTIISNIVCKQLTAGHVESLCQSSDSPPR